MNEQMTIRINLVKTSPTHPEVGTNGLQMTTTGEFSTFNEGNDELVHTSAANFAPGKAVITPVSEQPQQAEKHGDKLESSSSFCGNMEAEPSSP